MEDIEVENNGTLHDVSSLPPVPPRCDDSMLYGKYIHFFLQLPNQYTMATTSLKGSGKNLVNIISYLQGLEAECYVYC